WAAKMARAFGFGLGFRRRRWQATILAAMLVAALLGAPTRASALSKTTIPVGLDPSAIAVDTATNKIYVVNQISNDVTVIDGATNATSTIPVGFNPYAIAVNAATNKIYVANIGDGIVTVIDGATKAITTV